MSLNPHLERRLLGIQAALMAQHRGGRGLPNATVGAERETFLREYLQMLFPSHRRFATGAITDSRNQLTGQVDIAVEYGLVPSFPMPGTEDRLLLAESVALVIEVKSDLVAQWQQVRDTTAQVKKLHRDLNPLMTLGEGPPEMIPCIAVGYTGHATTQGLQERMQSTPEPERPDAALVIESGCFSGFGMAVSGPTGLYLLCAAIQTLLSEIGFAAPHIFAYTGVPDA